MWSEAVKIADITVRHPIAHLDTLAHSTTNLETTTSKNPQRYIVSIIYLSTILKSVPRFILLQSRCSHTEKIAKFPYKILEFSVSSNPIYPKNSRDASSSHITM